jgi:hypothetical protein
VGSEQYSDQCVGYNNYYIFVYVNISSSQPYRQDKTLELLDYHFDIEGVMKKAQ